MSFLFTMFVCLFVFEIFILNVLFSTRVRVDQAGGAWCPRNMIGFYNFIMIIIVIIIIIVIVITIVIVIIVITIVIIIIVIIILTILIILTFLILSPTVYSWPAKKTQLL